jgi:hypothetical protein
MTLPKGYSVEKIGAQRKKMRRRRPKGKKMRR